ncbi:exodeoxyribonuclease III [Desulfovibrio inopinatus]|uniref:exodeoxyribonuclease III n=1 Tax=Desulfovibrio inopinatus TaxID=102109 RepID=UPI000426759C|nr:exodeoxyribonuclease III [Desulfovibrio inopinatus]
MKLLCWNVNGFRAVVQKGFYDWLSQCGADVIGLQETKLQQTHESDYQNLPAGYSPVWLSSTVKKGYSGVACFYKNEPLSISRELPDKRFQGEGRLLLLEYPQFYYFNIYFPNGGMGPDRLEYKLGFYDAFLDYAQSLRRSKPIVVCGDFNTAHKEIDLKNAKQNEETSGFLPIERAWIDKFIDHGYIDTFRMFDQGEGKYTWWTYRFGARKRNAGWRIDYFFVSEELKDMVKRAWIDADIMGSDHCPVGLELEFSS